MNELMEGKYNWVEGVFYRQDLPHQYDYIQAKRERIEKHLSPWFLCFTMECNEHEMFT